MPDAAASKTWFSLQCYMCFCNKAEESYWEQTELISTSKNLSSTMYSFQKQSKFTPGNKVVDDPASNKDDFHWRDTWVSSP